MLAVRFSLACSSLARSTSAALRANRVLGGARAVHLEANKASVQVRRRI